MPYLNKYGVARHIYIPVPKAGSANHAVGADWTPVNGDVKISKDGGAAANVTNLPTAITMGNSAQWDFSLTATEMQAAQIKVIVSDAATKAVDDTGFDIETYGNASAQHAFDLGTASTAQTGDNYPRLGAPAGGSVSADVAAAKTDTAAIKAKTDNLPPDPADASDIATATTAILADTAQIKQDLPQRITKNVALAKFPFFMVDSSDHVSGKAGLTVTATRNLDGAGFGACANAVVEIGSGWYYIDFAAGDLNGTTVALNFAAVGADTRAITLITQPT